MASNSERVGKDLSISLPSATLQKHQPAKDWSQELHHQQNLPSFDYWKKFFHTKKCFSFWWCKWRWRVKSKMLLTLHPHAEVSAANVNTFSVYSCKMLGLVRSTASNKKSWGFLVMVSRFDIQNPVSLAWMSFTADTSPADAEVSTHKNCTLKRGTLRPTHWHKSKVTRRDQDKQSRWCFSPRLPHRTR